VNSFGGDTAFYARGGRAKEAVYGAEQGDEVLPIECEARHAEIVQLTGVEQSDLQPVPIELPNPTGERPVRDS